MLVLKSNKKSIPWSSIIFWIFTTLIYLSFSIAFIKYSNPNNSWDYLKFIFIEVGSLLGVISVYYANKKSMMFAFFGIGATLFKLAYPITQMLSGQANINYSVIIGQSIYIILGLVQFINFKKEKSYNIPFIVILILATIILLGWFYISNYIFNNKVIWAFNDAWGAGTYFMGSGLMALGNLWGFIFFILSDINWMIWVIVDIFTNPDMVIMASATLIQVILYIWLAILGWYEWKDKPEIY